MSWHFSAVLVAEYSAAGCSAGELSALSKLIPTAGRFSSKGRKTKSSNRSQSGTTSEHSTGDPGAGLLTWYREAFLARTSAQREKVSASTEPAVGCGIRWQELWVKFDRASSSWKTHRCLWEEDLPWSSVTLPKWGMMRDGVLWERATPGLPMNAIAFICLPTPTASMAKRGWGLGAKPRYSRVVEETARKMTGGYMPSPQMLEAVQGWPIGWTALEPLATARFRQWLRSHGGCSMNKREVEGGG